MREIERLCEGERERERGRRKRERGERKKTEIEREIERKSEREI